MSRAARAQSRWSAWGNLVLGVLVFLVPFLVGPEQAWHHWSNYTVGVIVAFLAVLTLASPDRRTQGALAGGVLELAFGVWVIATGFAAPAASTYQWANVVLGAGMAVLALWALSVGAAAARGRLPAERRD